MFLFFCKIMILAEKYLTKFLDNNKKEGPLNNFVKEIQSRYSASYRHAHPFILQWNITPKCNLRCKHCYYVETPEIYLGSKSISYNRNLSIVDEITNLNIFYVVLSGGEALLADGIFDILEKLKSKNITIYMHSNGIIIDEYITQKLAQIFVPELDGNDDTGYFSRETNKLSPTIEEMEGTIVNYDCTSIKTLAEKNMNVLEEENHPFNEFDFSSDSHSYSLSDNDSSESLEFISNF